MKERRRKQYRVKLLSLLHIILHSSSSSINAFAFSSSSLCLHTKKSIRLKPLKYTKSPNNNNHDALLRPLKYTNVDNEINEMLYDFPTTHSDELSFLDFLPSPASSSFNITTTTSSSSFNTTATTNTFSELSSPLLISSSFNTAVTKTTDGEKQEGTESPTNVMDTTKKTTEDNIITLPKEGSNDDNQKVTPPIANSPTINQAIIPTIKQQKPNSKFSLSSDTLQIMCNHELLTKNEELALGKEIQILQHWESIRKELEIQLERPPTYLEWTDAISKQKETKMKKTSSLSVLQLKQQLRRSHRAKTLLLQSNIRLVVSIAKHFTFGKHNSLDDCVQEGIVGLQKAVERYDPDRGFRFSTYATWWIKQRIQLAYQKNELAGLNSSCIRIPCYIQEEMRHLRKAQHNFVLRVGKEPTIHQLAVEADVEVKHILKLHRVKYRISHTVSLEQPILSTTKSKGGGINANPLMVGDSIRTAAKEEDSTHNTMLREDIFHAFQEILDTKEQAILCWRFGLLDQNPLNLKIIRGKIDAEEDNKDNSGKKKKKRIRAPSNKMMSYREIGKKLSISGRRIQQLELQALKKLRESTDTTQKLVEYWSLLS